MNKFIFFLNTTSHDSLIYDKKDQEINSDNYACEMRKCFAKMRTTARENLILSKQKRKELYVKSANEWIPMWGDQVLKHTNPVGSGLKLQSSWRGPYVIVDLPREQTAIIKDGNRIEKVHLNRLKRFHD